MREAAILVDFFWLSVCYTITTRDSQDPKTHNKNNTPPKKKEGTFDMPHVSIRPH